MPIPVSSHYSHTVMTPALRWGPGQLLGGGASLCPLRTLQARAEILTLLPALSRPAGGEYFGQTAQPVGVPSFVDAGITSVTLFFAVVVPDEVSAPAEWGPALSGCGQPVCMQLLRQGVTGASPRMTPL